MAILRGDIADSEGTQNLGSTHSKPQVPTSNPRSLRNFAARVERSDPVAAEKEPLHTQKVLEALTCESWCYPLKP